MAGPVRPPRSPPGARGEVGARGGAALGPRGGGGGGGDRESPPGRPSDGHIAALERSLGYRVHRDRVRARPLFDGRGDTGFAIMSDADFPGHLELVPGPTAGAALAPGALLGYIEAALSAAPVVSLRVSRRCPGGEALAGAVRAGTCCVEVEGDARSFLIFRTNRLSPGSSVECAITVGWDPKPCAPTLRQRVPPVLPGDDFAGGLRATMRGGLGHWFSVGAVTVSRRRASVTLGEGGLARATLDRPIVMLHPLQSNNAPYAIAAGGSPRVASSRLNALLAGADGSHYAAFPGLGFSVKALWEISAAPPPRGPYGVAGLARGVWAIAGLRERAAASAIQRWWRRRFERTALASPPSLFNEKN